MKHTDEDIEKVARAICSADGNTDSAWMAYKAEAIASIDTMFKPEPAKPRECWVVYDALGYPLCAYESTEQVKSFRDQSKVIHMREVME